MDDKTPPRMYRSERMNYILTRMRTHRDISPASLAAELNVSERTVYRDLKTIERNLAVKKRFSRKEGRYLLDTELTLPPLLLTASEAAALQSAAAIAMMAENPILTGDLHNCLRKLTELTQFDSDSSDGAPQRDGHSLDQIQDATPINDPAEEDNPGGESDSLSRFSSDDFARMVNSVQEPIVETIRHAIRSNRKLRIRYWAASRHVEMNITLAPYDVRRIGNVWFLLGSAPEFGGLHIFHVSRLRPIKIASDRFRFPRSFSADASFSRAWSQRNVHDQEMEIRIRFAATDARRALLCFSHQFSGVETLADGSIIGTVTVFSLREVGWWIFAFGASAEILSPPEARTDAAQITFSMAASYLSNRTPGHFS